MVDDWEQARTDQDAAFIEFIERNVLTKL